MRLSDSQSRPLLSQGAACRRCHPKYLNRLENPETVKLRRRRVRGSDTLKSPSYRVLQGNMQSHRTGSSGFPVRHLLPSSSTAWTRPAQHQYRHSCSQHRRTKQKQEMQARDLVLGDEIIHPKQHLIRAHDITWCTEVQEPAGPHHRGHAPQGSSCCVELHGRERYREHVLRTPAESSCALQLEFGLKRCPPIVIVVQKSQ